MFHDPENPDMTFQIGEDKILQCKFCSYEDEDIEVIWRRNNTQILGFSETLKVDSITNCPFVHHDYLLLEQVDAARPIEIDDEFKCIATDYNSALVEMAHWFAADTSAEEQ